MRVTLAWPVPVLAWRCCTREMPHVPATRAHAVSACCAPAQVLMRESGSDLNVIDLRYAGAEQVLAPSSSLS
jgi:hypothetical protein